MVSRHSKKRNAATVQSTREKRFPPSFLPSFLRPAKELATSNGEEFTMPEPDAKEPVRGFPAANLRSWKADMVEILGFELVRLWGSMEATTHVYPHMLCAHLGDEIRTLGVDIVEAQVCVRMCVGGGRVGGGGGWWVGGESFVSFCFVLCVYVLCCYYRRKGLSMRTRRPNARRRARPNRARFFFCLFWFWFFFSCFWFWFCFAAFNAFPAPSLPYL